MVEVDIEGLLMLILVEEELVEVDLEVEVGIQLVPVVVPLEHLARI